MVVTPLREASDVAMHSLVAPVSDAWEHLRAGQVWPRRPDRVSWNVVNLDVDGRTLRYRVTDNESRTRGTQLWAMSLHGYFGGGSMYARESEYLARRYGWRVVNPSLPGFGGSDPLTSRQVTIEQLTEEIVRVRDHLGIDRMLLLGHSMGAALAMHYAAAEPDGVLGVIYRDGIATPAWQRRRGAVARLLESTLPDVATVADMAAAVCLDLPDLLAGQAIATIRSMLPDLQHNLRTMAQSAPIATMLMSLDLTSDVQRVRACDVPLLAEWGCFDHLVPHSTATEFADVAGMPVHFVPGGHSWMLARPGGQADVLSHMWWGRAFLRQVQTRVDAS